MNYKVFIDSWAFINLFCSEEPFHKEVDDFFKECINKRYRVYTSTFIISETITFLYRDFGHTISKPSIDLLFEKINSGLINCIEIDKKIIQKALMLRYQLSDKPKISFTDLTSAIVMKEHDINIVLSMDKHFYQMNLGFELRPLVK